MTDFNYSSNFKITDDSRYQFLLASQNYGTFYSIFAKFIIADEKITNVILKVINYKGLLDVGFLDKCGNKCSIKDEGDELRLDLCVRALSEHQDVNIKLNEAIPLMGLNNIFVFRSLSKLNTSHTTVFDDEFFYRTGLDPKINRQLRKGHVGHTPSKSQPIPKGGGSSICYESRLKIV